MERPKVVVGQEGTVFDFQRYQISIDLPGMSHSRLVEYLIGYSPPDNVVVAETFCCEFYSSLISDQLNPILLGVSIVFRQGHIGYRHVQASSCSYLVDV